MKRTITMICACIAMALATETFAAQQDDMSAKKAQRKARREARKADRGPKEKNKGANTAANNSPNNADRRP